MTLKLSNIRTAYECYTEDTETLARACVEAGGGKWRGVQEVEGHAPYTLILFNSPATGSTLAIRSTEITSDLVRDKIKRNDAQFRSKA